ncbi:hypothetical protein FCI23_37080 [Actinacidiphila oryziradicis]|uniref:Uncharacterized protein n=1 Tax=Actinacidiphila oryziradicis TaxID=2571141 RepID=A0A4U0S2R3_9ACTN|nr:hypothetical protein FCI23_37080 [Actinacidiphila oryziradicis]
MCRGRAAMLRVARAGHLPEVVRLIGPPTLAVGSVTAASRPVQRREVGQSLQWTGGRWHAR